MRKNEKNEHVLLYFAAQKADGALAFVTIR